MYRLGKRAKSRRKLYIRLSAAFVVLVLLIAGGTFFAKRIHTTSVISDATPVITHVSADNEPEHTYDETTFTLQLPNDWHQLAGEKTPYDVYRWQSGVTGSDIQLLEVYQDAIPDNFAVNRVLALVANGSQITTLGSVSDNCADFTKSTTPTPGETGTLAKWQGINFLCDLNNYERDVVGTSSQTGINTVVLNGPESGSHPFFFAYTDDNINPDYSVFYQVLNSFRVK